MGGVELRLERSEPFLGRPEEDVRWMEPVKEEAEEEEGGAADLAGAPDMGADLPWGLRP